MKDENKNESSSPSKGKEPAGHTFSMKERNELRDKGKLTEEYLAAHEEYDERRLAPGTIMDAIERWHLEPETTGRRKTKWKKQPLTLVDKERVRRLFHKYTVTLEWKEGSNYIVAVVQAKDNVPPLPPLETDEIKLKIEWAKRRLGKVTDQLAKK